MCSRDHDGDAGVVAGVDTSALPVTGCVVSMTGCAVTGLTVETTLVGTVVRGVSGAPGPGGGSGLAIDLVVNSICCSVEICEVVVLAVTADGVGEVTGLIVTVSGGTSVVLVEMTSGRTGSVVSCGVVLTVGLELWVDEVS